MKIIYDMNQENPALKCYAENEEGLRLCVFGCYKLTLEETEMSSGIPLNINEISRWGTVKERKLIHKKISDNIL